MQKFTWVFLNIALFLGIFAFGGFGGEFTTLAKVMFFVFLMLTIISALMSFVRVAEKE